MSQLMSSESVISGPANIQSAGSSSQLFGPMCLKTHWDPEAIIRRTLPDTQITLPLDFRPWSKVCKEYRTSGYTEDAAQQPIDKSVVLPMGGEFYPNQRYARNIDSESKTERLDQPLNKWCETGKFVPRMDGSLYRPGTTVPTYARQPTSFVSELAMPRAVLSERLGGYECFDKQLKVDFNRSDRLFNNFSKQDRYKQMFQTKKGDVGASTYGKPLQSFPSKPVVIRPFVDSLRSHAPY